MAHLLGAEGIHLEYPTRIVFGSVTIGVNAGDRIGIVGRNGDGKSSLMRMLLGRMEPDGGRVTWRSGLRVGMLDQADRLDDDARVGEAIVGGMAEHEWAADRKIRDVITGLASDLTGTRGSASYRAGSAAGSRSPRFSPGIGTCSGSMNRRTTSTWKGSPGSPGT